MSALLVALLYCGWGIKTWGLRNCSVPSYNPTEKSPATILMFSALKTQTNTDFHTWVQKLYFYCILLYFCFKIHCNIPSHLWFLKMKTMNYHTLSKSYISRNHIWLYFNLFLLSVMYISVFCATLSVTYFCSWTLFFHLYYPDFDNSSSTVY